MQILWIVTSLLAGSIQTVRNATSKTLAKKLSSESVTFVRFAYAIPFTILYLATLVFLGIEHGQVIGKTFIFATLAAIAQATANFLMVKLFSYKNFAVTINFTKSDNLFAAIFGITLFGEFLSPVGWLAILLSICGIFLVNYQKNETKKLYNSLFDKSLLIGLSSGALFALSSFFVKFANSSYAGGNILANSALTLILVLVIQTILLAAYLIRFKKSEILEIPKHWKSDFAIGTTSSLASIFWFLSFSLAPVALVRTVGQVEMVLTLGLTHIHFKEKLKSNELAGILLTLSGIVLLGLTI